MLRLHGFAVSNYFNMAKLALLEKGVDFEINTVRGSQDAEFLAKSPRGKVPVLETEQGFISETNVILEYIEDTQGGKALLPSDPFARATVRALTKEIELYIELPARDRKSTRLNSSHVKISYAVFCLKKKTQLQDS